MTSRTTLAFVGTPTIELTLERGAALADALTCELCPALLGCRTGICGTCLAEVTASEPLDPPDADERELLELIAPAHPNARLLCCLRATADLRIRSLEAR